MSFLTASDEFRALAAKKKSTVLEKVLVKNDVTKPQYGKGRPNEDKRRDQCADALYAAGVTKL